MVTRKSAIGDMDKLVTGDSTKKQSISLDKKKIAIRARKRKRFCHRTHVSVIWVAKEAVRIKCLAQEHNAQEMEHLTGTRNSTLIGDCCSYYRVGGNKTFLQYRLTKK